MLTFVGRNFTLVPQPQRNSRFILSVHLNFCFNLRLISSVLSHFGFVWRVMSHQCLCSCRFLSLVYICADNYIQKLNKSKQTAFIIDENALKATFDYSISVQCLHCSACGQHSSWLGILMMWSWPPVYSVHMWSLKKIQQSVFSQPGFKSSTQG